MIQVLAVDAPSENMGIRIYPNPSNDYLSVEGADAGSEYSIIDYSGKTLISSRLGIDFRIPIVLLNPTNYILEIEGHHVKCIIK